MKISYATRFLKLNVVQKISYGKEFEKECNSWFWKGFTAALKFVKSNASWILGNREKISNWDYDWIPCKDGRRKPISPISNHMLSLKELWDSNKRWGKNKVRRLLVIIKMWMKSLKSISLSRLWGQENLASHKRWSHFKKSAYKAFIEQCG